LLKKGYSVRGTTRTQAKADQIIAKYPQYKDKLEIVIVEDIGKEGAFAGKLDDNIEGIFHIASPVHHKPKTSNKVDLIDPAVNGTIGILEAALLFPRVKRVVITSSFAALISPTKGPEHVYTEVDWNGLNEKIAEKADGNIGYYTSKVLSEKAAFNFVANKNPHFDIVTLAPPFVHGPTEQHVDKLCNLSETPRDLYEYVSGVREIEFPLPDVLVDVRDIADAHLLAYERSEPNQRYLIASENFNWQEVLDLTHKFFPNQTKAKVGNPGVPIAPRLKFDNSKSRTKLGLNYRSKEETFKDAIAQLLEFEKQGK